MKNLEFLRLDFPRPNCFHFAWWPLLLFLWILLLRVICDHVRSNTSVSCVLFGSNWWKQITVPGTVNIWCCNNISVLRSIYFSWNYSAITSLNLIKIKLLKRVWTFPMAIKEAKGPAFGKRLRCNHLLSDLWFHSVWIRFYFCLRNVPYLNCFCHNIMKNDYSDTIKSILPHTFFNTTNLPCRNQLNQLSIYFTKKKSFLQKRKDSDQKFGRTIS